MRAQHTPGPWKYEPTSGAIFFDDRDVEPLIASTNLECVSVEQGDADGHLIAAAPCLLAVARQIVDQAQGNPRATLAEMDTLIGAAIIAIAKAEGRS